MSRSSVLVPLVCCVFTYAACGEREGKPGDDQHPDDTSAGRGGEGVSGHDGSGGYEEGDGTGGVDGVGSANQGGVGAMPAVGGADGEAGDGGAANEPTIPMRDVTIRFRAAVGDAPFVCGQTYENVGSAGTTVTPQDLKFYVQDLKLVTVSGEEFAIAIPELDPWQAQGVALLDFADEAGQCAAEGTAIMNDVVVGRVADGHEYVGVTFRNGVPSAYNHADVTTLPAALQNGAMQWAWLSGYRFLKLEMLEVVDSGPVVGKGFAHPGSSKCSGNASTGFTCANANRNRVRLDSFDPDENTIVLDAAAVFANTNLSQDSQCHGVGEVCAAMFAQLGIDYDSGNALGEQYAYRVE